MEISHVGHGTLHTPSTNFHLHKVLHVPSASKSLVSVNKFTRDNNIFLEFHPDHFAVKEQKTRKTLLTGPCEGGLYPVQSSLSTSSKNKEVHGVFKPSMSVWHHRLGHPAASVVSQVLSKHKLCFVKESNKSHVCDACQQGKSHQLPYPKSTSVSTSPFDLVFSDV
jgi:histone deacetylase 1/2